MNDDAENKAFYSCMNEGKGLLSALAFYILTLYCTHMVTLHSSGLIKSMFSLLEGSAPDEGL